MTTRRSVLGVVAAVGTVGVAGCSALQSGDGSGSATGTGTGTGTRTEGGTGSGAEYEAGDPERYARFLGRSGTPTWATGYLSPSGIAEHGDAMNETTLGVVEEATAWTALDLADVDHLVFAGHGGIAYGFDRGAAREALTREYGEPRDPTTGGDYEAFSREGTTAPMLGEDAMWTLTPVLGERSTPEMRAEAVREIVGEWDGTLGALERDGAPPAPLRDVVDAIGAPTVVTVGRGYRVGIPAQVPNPVDVDWFGAGVSVHDDRAVTRAVYGYGSESDADATTLNELFGSADTDESYVIGIEDYDDLSVTPRGRTVRVQGSIATGRCDLVHAGDPDPPDVEFAFDRTGDELTITHDGGDPVPAMLLWVTVGEEVLSDAFGPYRTQLVEEGDAITIPVGRERGGTVRVRWSADVDPDVVAELASYELR